MLSEELAKGNFDALLMKSVEKELEERKMLKVGTKVIVTKFGKDYDGVIECADESDVPYLVAFNDDHRWFNADKTKLDGTTFRVAEEKPVLNYKFKIGDKVRIIDNGKSFPYYNEWFNKNFPVLSKDYKMCGRSDNGKEGVVVGRGAYSEVSKAVLYAILCGKKVYLFGERGIEIVQQALKRKAKVGDYVKFTHTSYGKYRRGSIGRVYGVSANGGVDVNVDGRGTEFWTADEYVVLENYVPKEKVVEPVEKKIEPKIGMWAKERKNNSKPFIIEKIHTDGSCRTWLVTTNEYGYSTSTLLSICELLPNYKPLRKWTDSEIADARVIIADIIAENVKQGKSISIIKVSPKEYSVGILSYQAKTAFFYHSKCNSTDEFNEHIGIAVALCKATGRKIPTWITGEKKV